MYSANVVFVLLKLQFIFAINLTTENTSGDEALLFPRTIFYNLSSFFSFNVVWG